MNKPKIMAFYLPQFHAIRENDEWWGHGFTEWTNVKSAKPQFKWHHQPEIPLHKNYYDLSNVKVMVDQAKLAQKYGIDGFVYYHYWFSGKKLLEKPLENMLATPDVNIKFCLCWANETWSRTWSGAEKEILIQQNYEEDEKALKEHFDYLLQFFKDDRYIKVNNKPMLIIYKPHLINNLNFMCDLWNDFAVKEGFDGIYLGFQHESVYYYLDRVERFNFAINFEPFYTVGHDLKFNMVYRCADKLKRVLFKKAKVYSYDTIWDRILIRDNSEIKKLFTVYQSAFPAWDNTPRRGSNAIIFKGAAPKKFNEYFNKLYLKCINDEFIFVNAWNEWAEGAHLEPDERNGFKYLESIKHAVDNINQ